jgi:hypothetical protein
MAGIRLSIRACDSVVLHISSPKCPMVLKTVANDGGDFKSERRRVKYVGIDLLQLTRSERLRVRLPNYSSDLHPVAGK